jgi:hypothetical protein
VYALFIQHVGPIERTLSTQHVRLIERTPLTTPHPYYAICGLILNALHATLFERITDTAYEKGSGEKV